MRRGRSGVRGFGRCGSARDGHEKVAWAVAALPTLLHGMEAGGSVVVGEDVGVDLVAEFGWDCQ